MLFLNLLATVLGCSDDGDGRFNDRLANYHQRNFLRSRSTEGAKIPTEQPMRQLHWGDINFIHITDTHGWLSGHPDQDPYSADWGDLSSFISHMKRLGDIKGVDTLVIETGDRHDGTGLSDTTSLDGSVSQPILAQQPLDVLSIGNHELYKKAVALQEYNLLRPYYGDHYLSSNVEIQINGTWVPAGNKYRKFHTPNKQIRILAFGFIFDFKGFDNGTRVITVENEIEKEWFKDIISRTDEYDLILLTGHMPVRGFEEFGHIVDAIRKVNPNVPIQGFGGHTHVRDFRVFDDNAVALESGRYLETIGWASVEMPAEQNQSAKFTRRYIDFNAANFAYHSNTVLNISDKYTSSDSEQQHNEYNIPFFTEKGKAISQAIAQARANLSLDTQLTTVDQDYWTNRAPYPGNNSVFTLAEEGFLKSLQGNQSRDDKPRYIITNTGNFRYDLLKGPYTLDSKYIVSPFEDAWLFVKDVPIDIADKILPHLNDDFSYLRKRDGFDWNAWKFEGDIQKRATETDANTSLIPAVPKATGKAYIPGPGQNSTRIYKGYVTTDDAGSDGDDTAHDGYTFYEIPNAIQASQNVDNSTKTVDVIFVDFLEQDIVPFIEKAGGPGTSEAYGGGYLRDLIEDYFKSQ